MCVIVGGGRVATRRAKSLLECGALVRIVAPEISYELSTLTLEVRSKLFESADLDGAYLAFAATSDPAVNSEVVEQARLRRILSSDAETAERGDFVVPSTLRRGDLVLAVTTGGASPALAKRIRDEISERYGPEYAIFCAMLKEIRDTVLETNADAARRRAVLQLAASDETALELIREGRQSDARDRLLNCISTLQG